MQVERKTLLRLALILQSQNRYKKPLKPSYEDIAVTYKKPVQLSCLYFANLVYG